MHGMASMSKQSCSLTGTTSASKVDGTLIGDLLFASAALVTWLRQIMFPVQDRLLLWLGTFARPPKYLRRLHRNSGEGGGPLPEL